MGREGENILPGEGKGGNGRDVVVEMGMAGRMAGRMADEVVVNSDPGQARKGC